MFDVPVHRTRPLPRGRLRGSFLIAEAVVSATRDALTSFALAGIYDGGHEGITYWAGRELGSATVITTALTPAAEHYPQRVTVSRAAVGKMSRKARSLGLGVLCQIHSHPGSDSRHSDGDDSLVLLPFEGMLSIVAPDFGIAFTDPTHAGVHQFQGGQWVLCTPESVRSNLIVVPAFVDLR